MSRRVGHLVGKNCRVPIPVRIDTRLRVGPHCDMQSLCRERKALWPCHHFLSVGGDLRYVAKYRGAENAEK